MTLRNLHVRITCIPYAVEQPSGYMESEWLRWQE
jgi:hypothetical protein